MRSNLIPYAAFLVFGMVILAGCADPSRNKPDAVVAKPVATPAADVQPRMKETVYTFQPASRIEFVASKITRSHNGGFHQFSGTVTMPDKDITTATIEANIDITSVFTDTDNLTKHLLSADFFEVENYPESRFASTAIEEDGDHYKVTGNFTLHGITKSITFPANINLVDGKLTAHAEFNINRKNFDIKYPGSPDDLIRDNVVITLDIEATP